MGWVWILVLNAALLGGAYLASISWFRQPRGLPRVLAGSVLAWTWVTLGEQILGSLGAIARPSLLGWALLGLGLAVVGRYVRPAPDWPQEPSSAALRWDFASLLALGLVLWVVLVLGTPSLMLPLKVVSDGPIYHLYFAVRWWKSGALELIPTPFGETAATYFPANGELWFLWLLAGLGGDTLAKVGQAPFLLLTGLASYALARELRAGPSASLISACWLLACVPLVLFSFEPNVDTFVVAGYLVSLVFLVRFQARSGGLASLILSGLAAGLALGSKPTSVVFLPPLILLGLGLILGKRDGLRLAWLRSAALVLSALVPSAYWYGRNVLLTGNPLYPAHVEVLGWTIWPGWYPRSAMRTSPYYFSGRDLGFLIDTVFTVFDLRMLPLWLGALGGLWAVRRSDRRPEDRWVWGLSALAILNLALFWVVIPYRTQQRFMFPAVALAAIPLARLLDRSSLLRWLAVGLLALHLLTPWDWPFFPHLSRYTPRSAPLMPIPTSFPELLARLRDPRRSLHLIPIFVVGPLTPGCVFFWARWWRSRSLGRLLSAAFTLLLIAVLSVVGNLPPSLTHWPVFPYFPQYLRAWQAVNYFSGPQGATIAYAGTDIPYYLFGSDLKNNVVYVNIDDHPSWLMHDYHRTASERGEPVLWETSRPGWGRLNADINAWVQNLADAQVDYLVVARCRPEQGPFNIADAEGFPYERIWAENNPTVFSPIYGVNPPDPNMKVFRFNREKIRRIER